MAYGVNAYSVRRAGGDKDRRRSHREPVVTVGALRTTNDSKEPSRQVLVSDVSMHGVGIRTFPLVAMASCGFVLCDDGQLIDWHDPE